jgi:hypothetical protein
MTQTEYGLAPFTEEDLNQPDDKLGQDLLDYWIAANVQKMGLDPWDVPVEIQEQIVSNTKFVDSEKVSQSGLEKAIKKAAWGDYARAGAMLRELVVAGAVTLVTEKGMLLNIERGITQRSASSKGGKQTAKVKADELKDRDKKIKEAADKLLNNGTDKRDIAAKLAKQFDLTATRIRAILKIK